MRYCPLFIAQKSVRAPQQLWDLRTFIAQDAAIISVQRYQSRGFTMRYRLRRDEEAVLAPLGKQTDNEVALDRTVETLPLLDLIGEQHHAHNKNTRMGSTQRKHVVESPPISSSQLSSCANHLSTGSSAITALLSVNSKLIISPQKPYLKYSTYPCVIRRSPLLQLGVINDSSSQFFRGHKEAHSLLFQWVIKGNRACLNYVDMSKAEQAVQQMRNYFTSDLISRAKKTVELRSNFDTWSIILENLDPTMTKSSILKMLQTSYHPDNIIIDRPPHTMQDEEILEYIRSKLMLQGKNFNDYTIRMAQSTNEEPFQRRAVVYFSSRKMAGDAIQYFLNQDTIEYNKNEKSLTVPETSDSHMPTLHISHAHTCSFVIPLELKQLIHPQLAKLRASCIGYNIAVQLIGKELRAIVLSSPNAMNLARAKHAFEILLEGHQIFLDQDSRTDGVKLEYDVHFPWFSTDPGKKWIRQFAKQHSVYVEIDKMYGITLYGPRRMEKDVLLPLYEKLLSLAVGKNQILATKLMERIYLINQGKASKNQC